MSETRQSHPWSSFLAARAALIDHLRREGLGWDAIGETITCSPEQAEMIYYARRRAEASQ